MKQIENKFPVNLREEVYNKLNYKKPFANWIEQIIDKYKWEEGIDYAITKVVKANSVNTNVITLKEYFTTKNKALIILEDKADNGLEIREKLDEFSLKVLELKDNPVELIGLTYKYLKEQQEQITTLEVKNKDLKYNLESNHLKITTPTDTGKLFTPKIPAKKLNKLAEYLGYIELVSRKSTKDPKKIKHEWRVTEKALGARHMDVYIHTEIGAKKFSKAQIGWTDEGIEYLKRNIERLLADLDNEEVFYG